MAGTRADHGPGGSGTGSRARFRMRESMTAGDVAGAGEVPFGDRVGEDLGGVEAGEFGGVQGPPQPPVPGSGPGVVARRQGGRKQVPVALLAGRAGLGDPDGVQQGQVIGVSEGLVGAGVAERCWPSRSRTAASTPSAVPAVAAGWPGRDRLPVRR